MKHTIYIHTYIQAHIWQLLSQGDGTVAFRSLCFKASCGTPTVMGKSVAYRQAYDLVSYENPYGPPLYKGFYDNLSRRLNHHAKGSSRIALMFFANHAT